MRWIFVVFAVGACVPQPAFVGVDDVPAGYITVNFEGLGKGHVVSEPSGIDCPSACTAPFVPGTNVTLSIEMDPGSSFIGWSGRCSGVDPCTVDTTAGAAITAEVACDPHDETAMNPGMFTIAVPSCVSRVTFDVVGAQGGAAGTQAVGGRGGAVHATIDVTPGEVLLATVGGGGSIAGIGTGGANGGGRGTMVANGMSAGGGGASDVRRGGTNIGNRIIVGAGGGGAHECAMITEGLEGAAGGADVGATYPSTCSDGGMPAAGGEQTTPGLGGTSGISPTTCTGGVGTIGVGGAGCVGGSGGGGGGGLYGGGGGAWGPGGGGSNLVPTGTDVTSMRGVGAGNGSIRVRW